MDRMWPCLWDILMMNIYNEVIVLTPDVFQDKVLVSSNVRSQTWHFEGWAVICTLTLQIVHQQTAATGSMNSVKSFNHHHPMATDNQLHNNTCGFWGKAGEEPGDVESVLHYWAQCHQLQGLHGFLDLCRQAVTMYVAFSCWVRFSTSLLPLVVFNNQSFLFQHRSTTILHIWTLFQPKHTIYCCLTRTYSHQFSLIHWAWTAFRGTCCLCHPWLR